MAWPGFLHGERDEHCVWMLRMLESCLFLTAGSLLLQLGSFTIALFGAFFFIGFYAATALAGILHLLAWVSFGLALRDVRAEEAGAIVRVRAMRWAFRASIAGFFVGFLTLPLVFGEGARVIIGAGLFPYAPTVFGPVVVAHAALFWFASENVRNRRASTTMIWGIRFLIAVAVTGLALFGFVVAGLPRSVLTPTFFGVTVVYSLAGLTSVGYGIVSIAWWREYRVRSARNLPERSADAGFETRGVTNLDVRLGARGWIAKVFLACLLLALGAVPLVGEAVFLLRNIPGGFFLGVPAASLHLIAWIFLLAAFPQIHADPSIRPPRLKWWMTAALLASLVGFAIGLATLPLLFPESFVFIVGYFIFPYVPTVYAPVVSAHGLLFVLVAKTFHDPVVRAAIILSSLIMIVVAWVAVAAQTVLLPVLGFGALFLVGIVGLGYAAIAVALLRELRVEFRTGVPLPRLT